MPRLHEEVMRLLVGEIVSAGLTAGDRLPREQDLAEQHQVSRGVARECIRGLEERGLVSVTHGIGATVEPPDRWDVFDPMILAAFMQGDHGPLVLSEYMACRRILEVEAAGLAAERATQAHLDAVTAAFGATKKAAQRAASNAAAEALYQDADTAFHRAIVVATENRALARMTEPLHHALAATLQRSARSPNRLEVDITEHARILRAIVGRNPKAARRAMSEHLATVEHALDGHQAAPNAARPTRRARALAAGAA